MFEVAEEMYFDGRTLGNKSTWDNSLLKLLKSPPIIASGTSTIFLPENFDEVCDRKKLLLQEELSGKNSNITIEDIVAIVDKLLEYKCKSTKQHSNVVNLFSIF